MKSTASPWARVRAGLCSVSMASLGLWLLLGAGPASAVPADRPEPKERTPGAVEDGILAPRAALPAQDDGDEPDGKNEKKEKEKEKGGDEPPEDGEEAAPEDDKEADGSPAGKTEVKKVDKDEQFVKEHLKDLLSPTSYRELEDGRAEIVFDLGKKDEAHRDVFTLNIGNDMKDVFRWSIDQEEFVVGGASGLRLSNKGVAFLRAWFTDEVEAEMEFNQYINFDQKHIAAVVFSNGKGGLLASNYGSQCMSMQGGAVKSRAGKTQSVMFDKPAKIKLKVQEGEFAALRDGREKTKIKYSRKTFASGQVGILWGGSISAIVTSFTVTGKIDYKKTAAELRKYQGKAGK